jgi:hypothetical protein
VCACVLCVCFVRAHLRFPPRRISTMVRMQRQGVIETSRVEEEEKVRRKMALDIVNFTIWDIKAFTLHVCV